jgi:hypothetical protein
VTSSQEGIISEIIIFVPGRSHINKIHKLMGSAPTIQAVSPVVTANPDAHCPKMVKDSTNAAFAQEMFWIFDGQNHA